jgi:Fe-S cluster biosynthesis and repair protein YggX
MDIETRIERFKQMAEADPDNELGHFSLGKALLEAQRPAEAAQALGRALEISRTMSKAYQLLGAALVAVDRQQDAVTVLTQGVQIADQQGDRMPRDEMAAQLRAWGAPVPEFQQSNAAGATSAAASGPVVEGFSCARCGMQQGKLEKPPFKGELGERILEHVCQSCWREWIPMGTKVINELGLSLSDPRCQDEYDKHMIEFLSLDNR